MKKWIFEVEHGNRIVAIPTTEFLIHLAKSAEEFSKSLLSKEDSIFFGFVTTEDLHSLTDKINTEILRRKLTREGVVQ